MEQTVNLIKEIIFTVIGLQFFYTAVQAFRDKTNSANIGTGLYWGILGIIFVFGSYIPPIAVGGLLMVVTVLTLFKQVKIGTVAEVDPELSEQRSEKLGNKIFIPVLLIGLVAMLFATFIPETSAVSVAFGAIASLLAIIFILKPSVSEVMAHDDRMVQQVSTTGILPQLLAALGAVFTAAGVGDVIAGIISGVVPDNSRLFGVIAYVLGMVIFTMIMGNAFAAFTVITAGIGIPFVFNLGGDPVVASALAMTAGFCGTLMTPMAGNFNALPVALLEIQDENAVIKDQIPVALVMIVLHIALMYFMAF